MPTVLFHEKEGDENQITCNINVVIAFEDAAVGMHADQFYQYLIARLSGEFAFTRYQWSFTLLEDTQVRAAAAQDAGTADIVIIATHGESELPIHISDWFQAWVGLNSGPMALVALFDRPASSLSARGELRSSLTCIAQTGRMDFFAEPDRSPDQSATAFIDSLVGQR